MLVLSVELYLYSLATSLQFLFFQAIGQKAAFQNLSQQDLAMYGQRENLQ